MEFEELISAPGMGQVLRVAPIFGGVLWVWLTVLLWRDGFNDLIERLTRPRWKGPERARSVLMLPLRALMLAGAAGLAAGFTTLGLVFNLGVILNIVNATRTGMGG